MGPTDQKIQYRKIHAVEYYELFKKVAGILYLSLLLTHYLTYSEHNKNKNKN